MRVLLLLVLMLALACGRQPDTGGAESNSKVHPPAADARIDALHMAMKRVEPFFRPMGPPQPGDWLAAFHEEGQTFDEWLQAKPTLPTADRRKIYVLPLGDFTDEQRRVIAITAGYLGAFYGLPVEEMQEHALKAEFPDVRHNQMMNSRQVKTGFILEKVLPSLLPADGAALIAFTDQDLFPDETMNYVFGQASLDQRVGVWSLFRLRDASFERFVRRTVKIAAHETGHMFSMHHCTKYECLMSGTNSIDETDRHPIDACPECMAKVCFLTGQQPIDRYKRLADFCHKNGLDADAADFGKKAAALR